MTRSAPEGIVAGLHRSDTHSFSKSARAHIRLIVRMGVEGDAHAGATIKLSRHEHGGLARKLGVMSIVIAGGIVRGGDVARVERPAGPQRPLGVV